MKVRKDKSFLLKTYAVEALVFLALCTLVGNLELSMEAHILMVPVGAIFGLMVASFIHNTSHSNIKNKVLNRVIGEFCGAWVLYGFSNFVMIHFLHHRYSDTDHDPVNPKGMSFLVFLFAPMRYMIKVAVGWLKEVHGHEKDYAQILATQTVLFHVNLVLKLVFWFMLLGPALFLCFYIPSLMANYGVHAHINYVCHSENEDGSIEILNLNHNLY